MRRSFVIALAATCFVPVGQLSAQAAALAPQPSLAVFLDCRSGCDQNFSRTELTWVNWVRDREVADVQILLTSYNYRTEMGISYTFGSIFNNIVNPRF